MTTYRELLGNQLATFRHTRGLTVRELAELAGVNSANICKLENGKYNASIDIIEKVCKALDVEIELKDLKL